MLTATKCTACDMARPGSMPLAIAMKTTTAAALWSFLISSSFQPREYDSAHLRARNYAPAALCRLDGRQFVVFLIVLKQGSFGYLSSPRARSSRRRASAEAV